MKAAHLAISCFLAALSASPCVAQEPRDEDEWPEVTDGAAAEESEPPAPTPVAPPPAEKKPWLMRLSWELGGGYFDYSETLTSIDAKSDFDSGCFAIRSTLEGNFSGLSPHLNLLAQFTGGTEEFRSTTTQQEDDLFIATVLLDVGCGFRLNLGETVTLIPSLAYTFDYLGFERRNFKIGGRRVTLINLDGERIDKVEETIIGHGVSPGIAIEARLTSSLDLRVHFIGTVIPEAEVDNDIGGVIGTEGYMVRGGFALNMQLNTRLGFHTSVEAGVHEYNKSTQKTRSGNVATAIVQFPDSSTVWVVIGAGVELRF
jgi:hypothetical protein